MNKQPIEHLLFSLDTFRKSKDEMLKWDFSAFKFAELLAQNKDSDFFATEEKLAATKEKLATIDFSHSDKLNNAKHKLIAVNRAESEIRKAITVVFGCDDVCDIDLLRRFESARTGLENEIQNEEPLASESLTMGIQLKARIECLCRVQRFKIEEGKLSGNGMNISRSSLVVVRNLARDIASDEYSTPIDRKQLKVAQALFKDMIKLIKHYRCH